MQNLQYHSSHQTARRIWQQMKNILTIIKTLALHQRRDHGSAIDDRNLLPGWRRIAFVRIDPQERVNGASKISRGMTAIRDKGAIAVSRTVNQPSRHSAARQDDA